ncbi:MAG: hypothetical protein NTV88_02560, partial [Candidatus Micrarchaeota archaeon]|nr:hypothetical protein [Candidatus Micrarchaeota archaeon]
RQSHSFSVGQALVHLEFSQPTACPRTFIIRKVDGEELLITFSIRGGNMSMEFEKAELSRKLLSFGLSEKQCGALLSEFERRSFSLDASEFVSFLQRFGHSKASSISLLRSLGASESDLLSLFESFGKSGKPGAMLVLEENGAKVKLEQTGGKQGKKQTKKSKKR